MPIVSYIRLSINATLHNRHVSCVQALESDIANFDKDRTARTKAAAAKLKAAKAGVEGARVAAREAAAVAMAAVAEQEAAEKEAADLTAQISAASPMVEGDSLPQLWALSL